MPLTITQLEDTFTSTEEGIKRLLSSILNLNIQHESSEKCITNVINKLLSTAKQRKQGLEYLNLLIHSCSASAIAEHALTWVNHCIIKFPDDILRELKLKTLGKVIEASHNESDFNKKFVSDYISKALDNCLTTSSINPFECKAALETLVILLKFYPSWFGPHRQKIEGFITIHFDSRDIQLVEVASLAFHHLQQTGGAGTNGINHKQNYTKSFHKLCKTLHNLYDKFFERQRELFQADIAGCDSFEFQDDPGWNSQKVLEVTAQRIKNVFKFLETMIRIKYPVAKETKPKYLLDVVTRGSSLHKCITGNTEQSLATYQFSLLLLELQAYSLKLLRLSIIWYQSICLPFSYIISKTIVESIQRSHNCDCYKLDSLYQENAYKCLSEWIGVSKSSLHPQFQAQILEYILTDITPTKSQVTLTISQAITGKKSQKAKRKAMANRIINSGVNNKTESSNLFGKSAEISTCKFALTALRSLLECTNLSIKLDLIKDLYKSVFNSLLTLQAGKPQHPYTDQQCQAKLYDVLVALYDQTNIAVLPPLQTTIDILNRGINGNNVLIRDTCQRGLRLLESICQPVCPSLYIGVDREECDKTPAVVEQEFEVLEEINGDNIEKESVDFDAATIDMNQDNDDISEFPFRITRVETDPSIMDEDGRLREYDFEECVSVTSSRRSDEVEFIERVIVVTTDEDVDGNNVIINTSVTPAILLETIAEEDKADEGSSDEPEIQNGDSPKANHTNNLLAQEQPDTLETEVSETNVDLDSETNVDLDSETNVDPDSETIVDKVSNISEEKTNGSQGEISAKRPRNDQEELITVVDSSDHSEVSNEVSNGDPKSPINVSEEPEPKKQKNGESAEADNGVAEVDPDASYLEEDSFVDEVKDYYQS